MTNVLYFIVAILAAPFAAALFLAILDGFRWRRNSRIAIDRARRYAEFMRDAEEHRP